MVGCKSELIEPPLFVITSLVGSVLSIKIPVPPSTDFINNVEPASLDTGILLAPNSSGVSESAVNLIVPPCPNTA